MNIINILIANSEIRAKVAPFTVKIEGDIAWIDAGYMTEKRTGMIENARERTSWVEYYIADASGTLVQVHRSAHVELLAGGVEAVSIAANFAGRG